MFMRETGTIDIQDMYWEDIRYFLDSPSRRSNTGILFVPGWSWAYEKRWQDFTNQVVEAGHSILWFEGWRDRSIEKTKLPCKEMTIEQSHTQIEKMLDILESRGCKHIWIVWKSAGWAMAITCPDTRIKAMSLLAAPLKLSHKLFNLQELLKTSFWDMVPSWKKAPEVNIDRWFLENIKIPSQFIHAEDDKIVPIDNLFDIQGYLDPEVCKVQAIKEWGHWYKTPESAALVYQHSIEFFNRTLGEII